MWRKTDSWRLFGVYVAGAAAGFGLGWLSSHTLADWTPFVSGLGMSSSAYDLLLSTIAGTLMVMVTLAFAALVAVGAAVKPHDDGYDALRHLQRQEWIFFPLTLLSLTFVLMAYRALGGQPRAAGLCFVGLTGFGTMFSFIYMATHLYRVLAPPGPR